MKRKGIAKREVERNLDAYSAMDVPFSSGRIFGSMCTAPHPLALRSHTRFQEANLGNPGLYPGTAAMEREVVSMLGSLLHLDTPNGLMLSGGTEANITALYMAKKRTGRKRVLFPRSAHFSVLKAVKLLDLEPVPIDLDERFRMSIGHLKEAIQGDELMVLCVAGSTELGAVDPISEVPPLAGDAPIHVDAAFGGFVLPFLSEMGLLPSWVGGWDFSVPGVWSLSVDPHKMGRSTVPAGCLLFREVEPLNVLAVDSPYLTSAKAYTLAGTRDSGAVAAAYSVMMHLGVDGYCRTVGSCMENTHYLMKRVKEIGLDPVMEPVMNILAVHHPSPQEVQERMAERGFYLSRVASPPAIRFVVMPHVTTGAIDAMVPELERVLGKI